MLRTYNARVRTLTSLIRRHYTQRELIVLGITLVAIVVATHISGAIFRTPAIFQPAAGIAIAALVLEGIAIWPAVLAGLLLSYSANDIPFLQALSVSTAHVVHAVVAAFILQKIGFDPVFRRIRDTFGFMIVSLTVSWIVPIIGMTGLYAQYILYDIPLRVTWLSWWLGIALSNVIIGAFVLRWWAKPHFNRTTAKQIETGAALIAIAAATYFLFWTNTAPYSGLLIVGHILLYVWFVLSLGMRFTLTAFLITTVIGITGVLYGYMPEGQTLGARMIAAEIYILALAAIFYPFIAVVEERQRAARDLHAQLDRIKALLAKVQSEDRAKNEFLAVFSHELRNPLAPIVSSLEYLKLRGMADPEISRIIDSIDERVRTITRLLDDLLDISRISRKTFKLRREIIDLRNVVRKAARTTSDLAQQKSIHISLNLPNHDVVLNADPIRIEQILMNLLNNAVKYTPVGGSVDVILDNDTTYAVLRVQDTGIGIKPEMLRRIFEPFLQLKTDHQHRAATEGLGIGLSLTEKLVLMHGGRIEAKSEGEGKGSEFIVHIPLAPITSEPVSATSKVKSPQRVLIVNDNETDGYALGQMLQNDGHRVDYATSGLEALQKVVEIKPQSIIADLGLPDMDGYSLARALREESRYEGLLVALFSDTEENDVRKIKSVGFDSYITKPIEVAQIRNVLRT